MLQEAYLQFKWRQHTGALINDTGNFIVSRFYTMVILLAGVKMGHDLFLPQVCPIFTPDHGVKWDIFKSDFLNK